MNSLNWPGSSADRVSEAATIRAWQSEALTSLVRTATTSSQVNEAKVQLATRMFDRLIGIFPIVSGNHNSINALYNKIIIPAFDLAITMQTSTNSYHFEPRMSIHMIFDHRVVPKELLGQIRVIDAATGKTLKPDSLVVPDRDGNIGEQVMTLSPALYRRDQAKFIPLSQEVILVELYQPLGRRRALTSEPDELA